MLRAHGARGSGWGEAPDVRSTSERILDAAELLFAERGFDGVAMRDLAAQVDLNPASLYNHFPSKQDLYEAVLERGLRPMFELLEALQIPDWAPERLDAATDVLLDHLARQPHLARLVAREALGGGEHLRQMMARWLRPLYERALATFRETRAREGHPILSGWNDDELPLLLTHFYHVVLGNFAVAPMLREVLDEDPLSREGLERQRRFARKLVRLLVMGRPLEPGPAGTP